MVVQKFIWAFNAFTVAKSIEGNLEVENEALSYKLKIEILLRMIKKMNSRTNSSL
jgi:hypothetical protein